MKNIIELFKKLWVKIIVEAVLVFLMWLFYYVSKNFLPKKYRIKESSLKDFLKTVGILLANSAKSDDGILSLVTKSKSLFEHFQGIEMILPNSQKEFQRFIADSQEELTEYRDYHFMTLVFPKLELFGKQEMIHKINDQEQIVRFMFEVEGKPVSFYTIRSQNAHSDTHSYNKVFACSKDYKYRQVTNLLFEITENKLYLSARDSDKLITEKLEMDFNQENYIVDEKLYKNLLDEIRAFRSKNIQRSYILNGPPGTGKTTFCLELSKNVSGKILKIDSNTFNNLASGAVKSIIENLTCDFIIVDDIDRIHPSDLSAFLYMLEHVKSFKNKPTLLATVNNIRSLDQAAIRPGRFDDIIEFDYPTKKERLHFFKKYSEKLNLNMTHAEIKKLTEATENMTQAYLKEYCLQYSIEGNVDKIIAKIIKRKEYLDIMENDRVNEDDVADTGDPVDEDDY